MRLMICTLAVAIAISACAAAHEKSSASEESAARRVVEQFEQGFFGRKLELIEAIVAPDLVVLENGSRNDGWADFRDHHLVSEMKRPAPRPSVSLCA